MNSKAELKRTAASLGPRVHPPSPHGGVEEHPKLNRALQACWDSAGVPAFKRPCPSVTIALSEEALQQMWIERLTGWSYYLEPVLLERIALALHKGKGITPEQQEYLKDLKNLGDDLRNFFQLFSVAHQIPKPIQSLVKVVGQVRDQVRLGEIQRARQQAGKLLALLDKTRRIHWPKLRVDPDATSGFLRERVARMQRVLARNKITALEFHQFKKDFRLVFSVYAEIHPRRGRLPAGNVLVARKKLVKKMHQALLTTKYRQELKYRKVLITLPEQFRSDFLRLLAAIKIESGLARPRETEMQLTSICYNSGRLGGAAGGFAKNEPGLKRP